MMVANLSVVKKNGENYRIVDYKEKKAYDFELVKGE